jgi:hypothetical protein
MWPDANVALRTGVKFWALDIDPKHGGEESYARLVQRYGALADTLRQKTGGGGSQYLYQQPEEAITGRAPLYDDWPGIDARGVNNYIVVPPSIHPNGNQYVWDTARRTILEEPVQPANPWLVEWVRKAHSPTNDKRGFEALREPAKFPKGRQQQILVSIAGKLRDLGFDPEEIEPLLQVVNRRRCTQPGPEKNIHQYAVSVAYPPKHGVEELVIEEPLNGTGETRDTGEQVEEARPVCGCELVSDVLTYVRRYVFLPASAYLPLTLWALATHANDQFDCFPYLAILSAVKRSGKTRLAEVLETLVRQPWHGTVPSVAALFRMLERRATLLLDEIEMFNNKNKSETTQAVLAVLNAGHRKGAYIPRCEPPSQKVRNFPVYGPKLFAAIGKLPDTLADRSIVIHMKRRTKAQPVERFRQVKAAREAKPIYEQAMRFAQDCHAAIEEAYGHVLDTDLAYLNDRDADLWTPLFAVCAVADSARLDELKTCALALSGAKAGDDVDDSLSLTLLRDIREVWPKGQDTCETALLLEKLKALEESPWLEHQLTARKLARMLRPFEVQPRHLRFGERTAKGYLYEPLKAAFAPYLEDLKGNT